MTDGEEKGKIEQQSGHVKRGKKRSRGGGGKVSSEGPVGVWGKKGGAK